MNNEQKLLQADLIVEVTRKDPIVGTLDFEKILKYRSDLRARQRVYKNFTDENGVFDIWTSGTDRDKQTLNELSTAIHEFERWLMNSPIYEALKEKYGAEIPEFLKDVDRDDKGRFVEIVVGWYQNSRGDLFHYDGTVWDNVPNEKINDLEFLGG